MTDFSTAGPREAPPGLVGRQSELVLLDGMLDGIHDGGTALVWRGEAGVGKSALLDAARASAQRRGINTLWTAGSVVEAGLAFSGLQRLLAPVLDRVTQLPERQRGVLLAAVGAGEGSVSDLYLVALATLELIRIVAGERTLLLIADDVHRLDGASRDVLGFVGRRVETEPVVVLAALRDGANEGITRLDLPERQLAGLDPAAAGDLLDARAPDLSPTARARLLERSAGNPLALVELSDTAAEIDGPMLPISARLKRAFAARLDDMPPTTRDVLLTAAADEASSLTEIVPAAELLGGRSSGPGALQPALDAGLVTIEGDMLRFRHPLVRAAVYQAADLDRRHAAHGALAEVLVEQPDRRAWHRAACVIGSDDEVAAELEAVAWRAHRRGAILHAATSLRRAAELTATVAMRVRRLLLAAELAFELGRADLVRLLVEDAQLLPLSERDRARADWLAEIFHDGAPGDGERVRLLVGHGSRASADGDVDLALKLMLGAALRCWWADPGLEVRREVVAAAQHEVVDARRTGAARINDRQHRGDLGHRSSRHPARRLAAPARKAVKPTQKSFKAVSQVHRRSYPGRSSRWPGWGLPHPARAFSE